MVSHPQWAWFPEQLLSMGRPYKLVHFWRNPVSKLSSGYLYHKSAVEKWTMQLTFDPNLVCTADQVRPKIKTVSFSRQFKKREVCSCSGGGMGGRMPCRRAGSFTDPCGTRASGH